MPVITTGYRAIFGAPFWEERKALDVHAFVSDVSIANQQATLRIEVAESAADWSLAGRSGREQVDFFGGLACSYAYQVAQIPDVLDLWGVGTVDELEGAQRTFALSRGAGAGPAISLLRDLGDAEGATYQVQGRQELPGDVRAALLQPVGETATADLIAQVLDRAGRSDLEVAVLDVGQGAAACLNPSGARWPLLYFDIGGGESGNQHTWPADGVRWCFTQSPPIILSHWHRDHYAGAIYGTEAEVRAALRQTWIAPDQQVGAKSKQLQARIVAGGGRLIIWPSGLPTVSTGCISLGRASGVEHNDSGLVLLLESADGRLSLLPGDAGYKFIDPSVVARYQEQGLKTLVVAHHGGLLARKAPSNVPAPDRMQGGAAVYSAGRSNSHGHPSSLAPYKQAGWGTIVGTDGRSVGAAAKHLGEPMWGSDVRVARCNGVQCSLAIWR
ncbi:hypothetical protein [Rhodanobacter sp. MP7CTX1]|uniref:hypothetical protein n=1 Tax=Rhodanobacter sp. MP7CTX1 TaxID=2723084 RepID=UPI001621DD41|nr:hypothetical protein [Rhodanobacter sp. MP7CTX1]MBB6187549.1 beta-lactamase superfamily II metal-dependent hydrolase [Rhodanobacter sp. MP7CTX1]